MPAISATSLAAAGAAAATEITLDGSTDSFVYDADKSPILMLRNPTGGALSPTIDGDGGTTVDVPGIGAVDVSSGYAVGSIAAGAAVAIPLRSIAHYLTGTIAITSGSGLIGVLLEQ